MQNSLFDRTHARRSLHSAAAPLHTAARRRQTREISSGVEGGEKTLLCVKKPHSSVVTLTL